MFYLSSWLFLCWPGWSHWYCAPNFSNSALHRNVSSERSEARRKLRECSGLVDSLMYIVQSQINCKDVDNKVILEEMLKYFISWWLVFLDFLRTILSCLPFFSIVGGEQRLSFEESVLPSASRSARLWALPGNCTCQSRPSPSQS